MQGGGRQTAAARRCAGPAAVPLEPRSRRQGWQASAAKPLSRQSSRTMLGGAEGEESLQPRRSSRRQSDRVPHGSSDDPIVHALVLLRSPGKALLPRGRCEPHDLSKACCVAQKIRNTCYNEKSYECIMFAVS
jgi:hypothetical protein